MSKDTTVSEDVVIGAEELAKIASVVGESLQPQLEKVLQEASDKSAEAVQSLIDKFVKENEESTKKVVKTGEDEEEDATKGVVNLISKGIKDGKFSKDIADMTPAVRFAKQMQLLVLEDKEGLKEYNAYGLASQLEARKEAMKDQAVFAKSGYANETTPADGSVLVPDAEFVTTVFENLPKYGVAFSDANVRQTDRTAVRVISLDSGLTFYATNEAGVKQSGKLSFSKNEVSLQKYAVIVPATDEFTDDAAIDYWNLVTQELTRAYAKKADEIVFTDAPGSASGSGGITNQTGVLTYTVGSSFDWDDMLSAQAKTEDDLDESNFKWYMRKETWYGLVQTRAGSGYASADGQGEYLAGSLNTATGWVANPNTPTTPWGTPVKFTRVLPTYTSTSANDAFAVYGDLRNYLLYNKRGMAIKMLEEATILDADGQSLNLATQDAQAMRAVVRMLGILPKGNRTKFVVIGKGTVS